MRYIHIDDVLFVVKEAIVKSVLLPTSNVSSLSDCWRFVIFMPSYIYDYLIIFEDENFHSIS